MALNKCLSVGAALALVTAVVLGFLVSSPWPGRLGLYRWIARQNPMYVGLTPAYMNDDDWRYTFEELDKHDLTGQTAIVTGSNSGVGFETANYLAILGASVTLACRNAQRCKAAAERIRSNPSCCKGTVSTMTLDVSSLASVEQFALNYKQATTTTTNDDDDETANAVAPLDMLYLNAGIPSAGLNDDGSAPLSVDGIELVFATNHVGHHLLYKLLEPLLLKSKLARVVLTSSLSSFSTFDYKVATDLGTLNNIKPSMQGDKMYGQTKLAQILFAKYLTRRLEALQHKHVFVNVFNPGAAYTEIHANNPMVPDLLKKYILYLGESAMWNSTEGALTGLYLGAATDELVEKQIRGQYFHPQAREVVNPAALDEDLQTRVWEFTESLVKDFL